MGHFYGCVRDWVSFVSDSNPIVQFDTTVNSQQVNTVKHSYSWFSSLITKQHCLSLIWISFSQVTVLYLCRFSSTSFKWTAFLVHVVRISFKEFLKVRPGLLKAWLVLTSVKYHGNLHILIPLNQRLALTRLRATGPWRLGLRAPPVARNCYLTIY